MAYFECIIGGAGTTLTVTCDSGFAGKTITCTDGTTTLTAVCPSASPYVVEFDLENDGTWTISGTISGTTHSTSITIDTSVILHEIPNGSTVTPVANIQTWLHCANIWDKTYTTINQVLADASTLQALIASNNAADYMARSTAWASSVCANANAMTYIGANNYCANKLLANSTWSSAICNSTYFESVLNAKVPIMTSNTSSIVSNGQYGDDYPGAVYQHPQYMAFDGVLTDNWGSREGPGDRYIGYNFGQSVTLKKMSIYKAKSNAQNAWVIKGSNDGNTWETIQSFTGSESGWVNLDNIMPTKTYKQFIVLANILNSSGNYYYAIVYSLQFYGRKDV